MKPKGTFQTLNQQLTRIQYPAPAPTLQIY